MARKRKQEEPAPPRMQKGAAIYEDGLRGAELHRRNKDARAAAEEKAEAEHQERLAAHRKEFEAARKRREAAAARAAAEAQRASAGSSPRTGRPL